MEKHINYHLLALIFLILAVLITISVLLEEKEDRQIKEEPLNDFPIDIIATPGSIVVINGDSLGLGDTTVFQTTRTGLKYYYCK